MADKIQQVIQQQPASAVASYDFIDLVSRTGYLEFFGSHNASWKEAFANIVDSEVAKVNLGLAGGAEDLMATQLWDIDFSIPQIVKGKLYAVATMEGSAAAGNTIMHMDMEVFHVDALAATTSLGSQVGSNITLAQTNSSRFVTMVDIAATNLKPGESLRMTLKFYGSDGGGSNNQIILWTDAGNRFSTVNDDINAAAKNATDLKFLVPFKVML